MKILFPGLDALPNMHPLFVHFPIALFMSALGMEMLAVVLRREKFHIVATYMLYLGAATALLTVITGIGAEFSLAALHPDGHSAPGHNHIHTHKNFMIITTLFGSLLAGYLYWINAKEKWNTHRWGLLVGLIILAGLTAMGSDRGARLVYEFGMGVNPAIIKTQSLENHRADDPHDEGDDHHAGE